MFKFISIPNTLSATSPFIFNVANITGVLYVTATTFAIYASGKVYTFTVTGGTAALTSALVNAINTAMFAQGPTLATVVIPTGASLAAVPAIT